MKYQKFGLLETLPKSNFDFASTLTLRESLIWVIPQNNNYMMIAMCSSDFRLQKITLDKQNDQKVPRSKLGRFHLL